MTSGFVRLLPLCGMLALVACAANDERNMPIPSAARGGVYPPSVQAEPMRHAEIPVAAPTPPVVATVEAPVEKPAPVPVPAAPAPAPVAAATPAPPLVAMPPAVIAKLAALPDTAPAPAAVTASVPVPMPVHAPAPSAAREYVLGMGDEIRLTVYGEDDLSGQYQVGSTGVVALPLIGNIDAAGHTVGEFEAAVRDKLSQGYLKDPRVSAQVANYRPFFILGEVAKPGSYPYVNGMTVLSAVATAGGYTYRADNDDIRITHADAAAKKDQNADESAAIMPGDIIRVTERFF